MMRAGKIQKIHANEAVVKRLLKHHDQLVETIYHSAVEPLEWQTVLTKLVYVLDGRSALMLFLDGAANSLHASYAVNVDETYLHKYVEHYMNVSPCRPELRYKPKGRFYSSYLDFDHTRNPLERSEFYDGWARPQGIEHAIVGNVIATADCTVQLLVYRASAPGHFTREETAALNHLFPFMQRALELQRVLEEEQQLREGMYEAKWRSYLPCILLNGRLEVVHVDEGATRLLETYRSLCIVGGKVLLRNDRLNRMLQRQLKACTSVPAGQWNAGGESVCLRDEGGQLELHTYPLHSASQGAFSDGGNFVALYLNDPRAKYVLNERLVQDIFRLSPAELRLAEAICNGLTLEEFAKKNHTTLNTVRSQAKPLFAKTGVRRQAELPIRLLPYLLLR